MEAAVLRILRDYGYEEDVDLDATINLGEAGSTDNLSEKHFENMLLVMRKDELKSEARKCHLPLAGNKIDLVLKIIKTYFPIKPFVHILSKVWI